MRSVRPATLRHLLGEGLPGWRIGRSERVDVGFYKSEAMELLR